MVLLIFVPVLATFVAFSGIQTVDELDRRRSGAEWSGADAVIFIREPGYGQGPTAPQELADPSPGVRVERLWRGVDWLLPPNGSTASPAIPTATITHTIDGAQNSHRQCSGANVSNPQNIDPASNAGPSWKMKNRPRLIMNPKIPANRPRSVRENHAVLIFTIPGAPNDCRYPFTPHSATNSQSIPAKLAAPNKFCVNFMGDAAFGMTGLDFETAVRSDIPILTIVLNNSSMAVETRHMKTSHDLFRTRDLRGNYSDIAKAMGGWSERVTDPGEIKAAIGRARKATDSGRAALLEFVTAEEHTVSHLHEL